MPEKKTNKIIDWTDTAACLKRNRKVYRKMRDFFLDNPLAAPIRTDVFTNALNDFSYGPMLHDDAWKNICTDLGKDPEKYVTSASEMEEVLGRNIRVEELMPSVLSLSYLFFGYPTFTGSKAELYNLFHFYEIMVEGIGNYARTAADDVIGEALYHIIPELFKEFPQ